MFLESPGYKDVGGGVLRVSKVKLLGWLGSSIWGVGHSRTNTYCTSEPEYDNSDDHDLDNDDLDL